MAEFLTSLASTLPIAAPIGITGSAPLDARTVVTHLFETKDNSEELNIPSEYADNFYAGLIIYNKSDEQLYLFTGKTQDGKITRNCFVAINQGTTLIKDPVDGEYTKGLLYLAPQDYVASEIQQGDAVWCTQSGDASTATFVKAGFNVSLPENVAEYGSEKKVELVYGNNGYEPSVENIVEIGSAGKILAVGSVYILKVKYLNSSREERELIVNGSEFLIPDAYSDNKTLTVYYSDLSKEKIALIDESGKVTPSTKTIQDLVEAALTGGSVEVPEDPDAKIPTIVIYPEDEDNIPSHSGLTIYVKINNQEEAIDVDPEIMEISDKIFVRLSTNSNEVSTVYLSKCKKNSDVYYTGILKQNNKTYIIQICYDQNSGIAKILVNDKLADNSTNAVPIFTYVPDGTVVGGDSFVDIVANGDICRMKFTVN